MTLCYVLHTSAVGLCTVKESFENVRRICDKPLPDVLALMFTEVWLVAEIASDIPCLLLGFTQHTMLDHVICTNHHRSERLTCQTPDKSPPWARTMAGRTIQ